MGIACRQILCVDDDAQSLKVRKVLLESHGFVVATASSGPEGLRAIRSRAFDAVVLDYHMPGMDGGEVARETKKWDCSLPVVVLSALPWLPDDAPEDCIDAFVSKSEPTAALVSKLEAVIAERPPVISRPRNRWPNRLARYVGTAAGLVASTVRHRKPTRGDADKTITRSVVA